MLNPMEEDEDDVRRPLAVTHLLQHTLRSLCNSHSHSHWVYAVFWRILPRNYPPPKWEDDRSRGNRRNWILVWEDGFCNFAASSSVDTGLQPDLFFKMSHEIYNYGEGFIGKVAADHAHKWIYKEPNDHEINFLSSWHNSPDTQPRTWEAQFQSGIKTIALIAVREGVVQLGAVHKVIEDLSYVVFLRKKFNYIESIPGVLLPHPSSSSSYPFKVDGYAGISGSSASASASDNILWQLHGGGVIANPNQEAELNNNNMYDNVGQLRITPSMSSLEALLSKLPSVVPPPHTSMEKVAKEEIHQLGLGQPETTTSFSSAYNRFPNTTSTTSNQKY